VKTFEGSGNYRLRDEKDNEHEKILKKDGELVRNKRRSKGRPPERIGRPACKNKEFRSFSCTRGGSNTSGQRPEGGGTPGRVKNGLSSRATQPIRGLA